MDGGQIIINIITDKLSPPYALSCRRALGWPTKPQMTAQSNKSIF